MRKGYHLSLLILFFSLLILIASFSFSLNILGFSAADAYQRSTQQVNPNLIWNSTFGGTLSDEAYSIVKCQEGGYLIAGSTENDEFTPPALWLIRIDHSGNVLWDQSYSGINVGTRIKVIESQNGFKIVGSTITNNNSHDVILIQISSLGNLLYTRTYGGIGDDCGYSITEVSQGGYVIAGCTNSFGAGEYDFWLIKITQNGVELWNRTYGGPHNDVCYSIIENAFGDFVLAGYTESFGAKDIDILVIRTNSMGESYGERIYGDWGNDICLEVIENEERALLLVGYMELTTGQSSNAILINTYSDGEVNWRCVISDAYSYWGFSIVECHNGGYAIAGSINYKPIALNQPNLLLARISDYGVLLWHRIYGGSGYEIGWSIVQSENQDFVLCGTTTSYGNGNTDVWLIRVMDGGLPSSIFDQFQAPNLTYIGLGVIFAFIVLLGSYTFYRSSKKEISGPWLEPPKGLLRNLFLKKNTTGDLSPVVLDFIKCAKCDALNLRAHLVCWGCGVQLHQCMVCNQPIQKGEKVSYCPWCGRIAHRDHLFKWLETRHFCPYCEKILFGQQVHRGQ